jgi:acyl-CoA synthetase (AMP-forming)/AMP-acid ligase II
VRAFCRSRLADYKVPELVTIGTEPLPRNANGKLQKHLLRRQAAEMAE